MTEAPAFSCLMPAAVPPRPRCKQQCAHCRPETQEQVFLALLDHVAGGPCGEWLARWEAARDA